MNRAHLAIGVLSMAALATACSEHHEDLRASLNCSVPVTTFRSMPPTFKNYVATSAEVEFAVYDIGDSPSQRLEGQEAIDAVDAPGFAVQLRDDAAIAVAPDEPGVYTWRTRDGHPLDINVYDPATITPIVDQDGTGLAKLPQVAIGLAVDGNPVCVHGRDEPAIVDVAGDGCAAVFESVEAVPPLKTQLGSSALEFQLLGGPCTVTAHLANGTQASRQYEAAQETIDYPVPTNPLPYSLTLNQRVDPGGACPGTSTTDGDCSYPYFNDRDCYTDASWSIELWDPAYPGTMRASDTQLGVGLTVTLKIELVYIAYPIGPPENMTIDMSPSTGLTVKPLMCDGNKLIVSVTPTVAGSYDLTFHATGVYSTGTFHIDAVPVDVTHITLETNNGYTSRDATKVELFTQTEASVEVDHQTGAYDLFSGIATLDVTTDTPSSGAGVIPNTSIVTGKVPETLHLTSIGTLDIAVLDEAGILGVEGLAPVTATVGQPQCLEKLTPLGSTGKIYGKPPRRPRVVLDDTLWVIGGRVFDGLCVTATEPGAAQLKVEWGSATPQTTWTFVP